MLYVVNSSETNETIAVFPDRTTAELIADALGLDTFICAEASTVGEAIDSLTNHHVAYVATEWARKRIDRTEDD